MRRVIICVFCLLIMAPGSASALLGYEMEIGIGGYNAAPDGWVQYGPDSIYLDQNLGYDAEWTPIARFKAEMPLVIPNLYANISPVKYDGPGASGGFSFGGEVFAADFKSEFSLNQYDLTLFYHIPAIETLTANTLSFEIGLAGRYVEVEAQIEDANRLVKHSIDTFVPLVYAAGRVGPFAGFRIEAEAWGMGYDDDHWVTLVGRLGYDVWGPLFLTAGYRYDNIIMSSGSFKVDTRIHGPFAELGFRF